MSNRLLRTTALALFASLLLLEAVHALLAVVQQELAWYLVLPLKTLPLLACLPFLLQNRKRAYIGLGFLLCLYFMQPVVELVSGVNPLVNALLIANIIALFIAALLFIRRYTE